MEEIENTYREGKLTIIQLTITLILIVFFTVTGATYAYLTASSEDNSTITGNMATVNLTLDVDRIFPLDTSDNTGVIVPQLGNNGALSLALKSGCVDDNNNVVCQVYKINIKNVGGTATQIVDGKVMFYGNNTLTNDVSSTMPSLRWKLISSADTQNPNNSVLGNATENIADATGDDNVFADEITMVDGTNLDYYMIIWIDETNEEQNIDEGNSFYGKVLFESSNGTGVTATFSS